MTNGTEATTVRNIVAERYKTKMCRNYVQTGVCPYETRCMFAHGDHELRTAEQNLADGLVTEEAVKLFQRSANRARDSPRDAISTLACGCAECVRPAVQARCQCDDCLTEARKLLTDAPFFSYNPYSNFSPYHYWDYPKSATKIAAEHPCDCDDCRVTVSQVPIAP